MKFAKEVNARSPSVQGKQVLIFGGTSGIGEALGKRLAVDGASVTIVGRNEQRGNEIIEELNSLKSSGAHHHSYLKADVSVMANGAAAVREFNTTVFSKHQRLDLVIFCQTKATLQGRTPTVDSIDEKLALNYFSRVFLTKLLMPMLEMTAEKHSSSSSSPRVMSVLSAGQHKPYALYREDPYLSDENYSQLSAADITSFYTDIWAEKQSQLHRKVSFIHIAPGFVNTNWGTDMPWIVKVIIRGAQAAFAKSGADCAEFLMQALVAPKFSAPGFHLLGEYAQDAKKTELHSPQAVEVVSSNTDALLKPFYEL